MILGVVSECGHVLPYDIVFCSEEAWDPIPDIKTARNLEELPLPEYLEHNGLCFIISLGILLNLLGFYKNDGFSIKMCSFILL